VVVPLYFLTRRELRQLFLRLGVLARRPGLALTHWLGEEAVLTIACRGMTAVIRRISHTTGTLIRPARMAGDRRARRHLFSASQFGLCHLVTALVRWIFKLNGAGRMFRCRLRQVLPRKPPHRPATVDSESGQVQTSQGRQVLIITVTPFVHGRRESTDHFRFRAR
jgi:hypothetical protein